MTGYQIFKTFFQSADYGHGAAMAFVLIAYLVGNANFADYLQIHFVQGTGELAVKKELNAEITVLMAMVTANCL